MTTPKPVVTREQLLARIKQVRNNTRCYKQDCKERWRAHKLAVRDLHDSRMEMHRLKAALAALDSSRAEHINASEGET